uniref:Mediator of RNA polymerase II transcription subunit 13 n=1 Tax=Megaselia scalaris TaxID=36166 RepID=T1H246_MEGSC
TDLCGIKWRKFFGNERPNTSLDPLEDPILRSYSRCLDMNILCVWRRVESPRQEPDPNSTGGIFDSITNTTTVHPPLSLTAAKELWIFWYGEEPELSGAVDSQLLKQGAREAMISRSPSEAIMKGTQFGLSGVLRFCGESNGAFALHTTGNSQ